MTDLEKDIECAKADIEIMCLNALEKAGHFEYDCYLKTCPKRSVPFANKLCEYGFEEYDQKLKLDSYKRTKLVRNVNDPDERLGIELTEKIAEIISPIVRVQPFTRVMVSVNGSVKVSISK